MIHPDSIIEISRVKIEIKTQIIKKLMIQQFSTSYLVGTLTYVLKKMGIE
ncbi:hypothetical protein [Candidatus Lokiarchaeum ossiferum]